MRRVFGVCAYCACHTAQMRTGTLAAHEDSVHIDVVFVCVLQSGIADEI